MTAIGIFSYCGWRLTHAEANLPRDTTYPAAHRGARLERCIGVTRGPLLV